MVIITAGYAIENRTRSEIIQNWFLGPGSGRELCGSILFIGTFGGYDSIDCSNY